MDALFSHYEQELLMLRRLSREYAQRYPKVAGHLQMVGEHCDDPHVEQLIQSVALLSARIAMRLDDDYSQFTEALFETLYPHYLRPFPSCSVARAEAVPENTGAIIPRGTVLESAPVQGIRCLFRTAYDLPLTPVRLDSAEFQAVARPPSSASVQPGVGACISIGLSSEFALHTVLPDSLRVYLDGDSTLCATLRDNLFLHAAQAFVEPEGETWRSLAAIPIQPVGFAEEEALIPFQARSHPAYRLLTEYFAFPDKFNFFDIDLIAVRGMLPPECHRLTLHLMIRGLRADSSSARMLSTLTTQNLLLGCTPVVNLFRQHAVPVSVDQRSADYAVLAHAANPELFEIYSVDEVTQVCPGAKRADIAQYRPLYSFRHDEQSASKGRYWVLRHNQTLARVSPGHEKSITLVDIDGSPVAVDKACLSMELTCTNRDLPSRISYGLPEGDLFMPGQAKRAPLRMLRRPTPPYRFENGHGMHWRLISHLALNHHALMQEGLPALREMLTLYDLPNSPISQRQIAGITALEHLPATHWLRHPRGATLAHGVEVRMTLDEEAYTGTGLFLFVQVIDRFLALYVHLNSFVQLVAVSHQTGEELIRCPPRSGSMNLV